MRTGSAGFEDHVGNLKDARRASRADLYHDSGVGRVAKLATGAHDNTPRFSNNLSTSRDLKSICLGGYLIMLGK